MPTGINFIGKSRDFVSKSQLFPGADEGNLHTTISCVFMRKRHTISCAKNHLATIWQHFTRKTNRITTLILPFFIHKVKRKAPPCKKTQVGLFLFRGEMEKVFLGKSVMGKFGATERNRTDNLMITNHPLCLLSYDSILARKAGVEPASRFFDDGLANRSNTDYGISAHLVEQVGVEPTSCNARALNSLPQFWGCTRYNPSTTDHTPSARCRFIRITAFLSKFLNHQELLWNSPFWCLKVKLPLLCQRLYFSYRNGGSTRAGLMNLHSNRNQ